LELLALNNTGIKSLVNLPDAPNLSRIEMTDNHMSGAELKHLLKYTKLTTVKFGANNIKELAELEVLSQLQFLVNLDLSANPVSEKEGYKERVFEIFPKLVVLDGYDREGNDVMSEAEDDDDYGDEELEQEGDEPVDGDDDEEGEFEDDGEEGEGDFDEDYDDEEASGDNLGKRGARGGDDSEEEAPPKKRK
jgi:Leucine-rich repeat